MILKGRIQDLDIHSVILANNLEKQGLKISVNEFVQKALKKSERKAKALKTEKEKQIIILNEYISQRKEITKLLESLNSKIKLKKEEVKLIGTEQGELNKTKQKLMQYTKNSMG